MVGPRPLRAPHDGSELIWAQLGAEQTAKSVPEEVLVGRQDVHVIDSHLARRRVLQICQGQTHLDASDVRGGFRGSRPWPWDRWSRAVGMTPAFAPRWMHSDAENNDVLRWRYLGKSLLGRLLIGIKDHELVGGPVQQMCDELSGL